MNAFEIIFPIAVGSLIGYCTNYIAIKMLFRPTKEIRIWGKKLPFTPGVIPKNQGRLAKAAGDAVGNNLLTKEDITNALKSEKLQEAIGNAVADAVTGTELTVGDCMDKIGDREVLTEKASVAVTEKIKNGLSGVDFSSLIVDIAGSVIQEKVQGTMMAMFVNEGTIAFLAEPVGEVIQEYIRTNGGEVIYPMVKNEIDSMKTLQIAEILETGGIDADFLRQASANLYGQMIDRHAETLMEHFNVSALVEAKINAMDVNELEELVMSVMKNELQAVINLGAVIGAVIGILNVFII